MWKQIESMCSNKGKLNKNVDLPHTNIASKALTPIQTGNRGLKKLTEKAQEEKDRPLHQDQAIGG